MCLAIPTLIVSVDGQIAQVEIGGIKREISLALTPEARAGDYVIVHTGFALSVLDEEEAQETLRLFAEMGAFDEFPENRAGPADAGHEDAPGPAGAPSTAEGAAAA
jgi:hydrogenase expression/formation protein HypC